MPEEAGVIVEAIQRAKLKIIQLIFIFTEMLG
jgi:hypothetical protein